jgi:microcin C transport system substrate-binding protein
MRTLAAQVLPAPMARAQMVSSAWYHGASSFGDLKYPSGFTQFNYVNAKAPKGGAVRQIALGHI